MSKVLKPRKPRPPKHSDLPLAFLIRKSRDFDPPVSRELLGPPKSVKVHGKFGVETAILRMCTCDWCGKQFENHGPSVVCEPCMAAIDFAMEKLEGVSEGNLPSLVTRTVGTSRRVEGKGVRPKTADKDTGEPLFKE